jgi:hypothetical protein
MVGRDSDTVRYLRSRDRVLGRRMRVSQDPELAADQLAEQLGGHALAVEWARTVVATLDGRERVA